MINPIPGPTSTTSTLFKSLDEAAARAVSVARVIARALSESSSSSIFKIRMGSVTVTGRLGSINFRGLPALLFSDLALLCIST